jgi:hypothetical protein
MSFPATRPQRLCVLPLSLKRGFRKGTHCNVNLRCALLEDAAPTTEANHYQTRCEVSLSGGRLWYKRRRHAAPRSGRLITGQTATVCVDPTGRLDSNMFFPVNSWMRSRHGTLQVWASRITPLSLPELLVRVSDYRYLRVSTSTETLNWLAPKLYNGKYERKDNFIARFHKTPAQQLDISHFSMYLVQRSTVCIITSEQNIYDWTFNHYWSASFNDVLISDPISSMLIFCCPRYGDGSAP